ncbi:hypothetical protein PENARI_c018G06053 [Penicillium arizonense]|uniref:Zn(2)-C6 fungal-type domain-containing protein n=1 Tax=Penicillium arizonense TaxID=1835702 RepID=A0A1F5LB37_PENAI|nr:hypothetical protein PENARI_c018G06053 [Penicillium arizonense]OGE50210.1 hypothetical protein PENARI_c018G06053 [Penicillium arizonense]
MGVPICDEQRPSCTTCSQRQDECVYNAEGLYFFTGNQPRRPRRTRQTSADNVTSPSNRDTLGLLDHFEATEASASTPGLNMEQLELELQWIMHTHKLLARSEETRKVWELVVLQEALKAPFLMHGILGLSALHLSRLREPESQPKWLSVAISHKNIALSMFSEQLSNIDHSNVKAMMSFAGLVVAFGLGSVLSSWTAEGPSLNSLIEIFHLSRGVQAVANKEIEFLRQSNLAPLFDVTQPEVCFPDHVITAFDRLYELNAQCGQQSVHHNCSTYERVLQYLRELVVFTLAQPSSMTLAAGWAIRAPAEYLNDLDNRVPFSLVVLAHYCGFLHMARENWCVGSWGRVVLEEIKNSLTSDWQPHIEWADEQVGRPQNNQSIPLPMET